MTNKDRILKEVNDKSVLQHYRDTGRTPLSGAFYPKYSHHDLDKMRDIWDKKFTLFKELLLHTQGEEYKELLTLGIGALQRIIKRNLDYEVISYFEDLKSKLSQNISLSKWESLFKGLSGEYIQSDFKTFAYVMENKNIPGECRILWKGSAADAMYFQKDVIKFKLTTFNKCFVSNTGKPFHEKLRQNTARSKEFTNLCSLYPVQNN